MDSLLVRSRPMRLHWAGWETDTLRLQNNGWQISAEQDPMNRRIRVAINHPHFKMQGISNVEHFDFAKSYMDHYCNDWYTDAQLSLYAMSREIYIREHSSVEHSFCAIDAIPTVQQTTIRSLSDFAYFQTVQKPQHEIFLKEASLEEILEMALNKQEPAQEQIRKRIMHEQNMKRYGILHTELKII